MLVTHLFWKKNTCFLQGKPSARLELPSDCAWLPWHSCGQPVGLHALGPTSHMPSPACGRKNETVETHEKISSMKTSSQFCEPKSFWIQKDEKWY